MSKERETGPESGLGESAAGSAAPQVSATPSPAELAGLAARLGRRPLRAQEQRALVALQLSAGNAAVGRLLRRAAQAPPAAGEPVAHAGGEPADVLQRLGPGRPLEPGVRTRMAGTLGTDLSGVRIHDDPRGAEAARSLDARAFAVGEHVGFAAGQYAPDTLLGDALLAHELAHVVQQDGGRGHGRAAPATAALEADADRSAVATVARLHGLGEPAARRGPALRAGLRVQRCGYSETAAFPETTPGPRSELFAQYDVIYEIATIQKPLDVSGWWKSGPKQHKAHWAGPLSYWEKEYIRAYRSPTVPAPIQLRDPVDPAHLTAEEAAESREFFGEGADAPQRYANYENRRRIVAHYVLTHPATVRYLMGTYRLTRDVNPLHFAFERGWQMGSGEEMFTGERVSRWGAAAEFALALAIGVAVSKGLAAVRPPVGPATGATPFMTPEIEEAFRSAVRARGDGLIASMTRAQRGPVLSGVLDTKTGRTFFGINRGEVPPNLHPILKARLEAYLSETGGVTPPRAGLPGAHSEIDALNQALLAREAMTGRAVTQQELGEFVMHNKSLWPSRPQGVPPPCENCGRIVPPEVRFLP